MPAFPNTPSATGFQPVAQPRHLHLIDADPGQTAQAGLIADALGLTCLSWPDGHALGDALPSDTPGVALLHVTRANSAALDILRSADPTLPLIILARQGSALRCRQAFKAGVWDYFASPPAPEELQAAISGAIAHQVLENLQRAQQRRARQALAHLSERETEVLGRVIAGLTNKEIARALVVSPRTIEVHRSHIALKLGATTLAELVRRYAPLLEEQTHPPRMTGARPFPAP